jgi:hypothetical protein
MSAPSGLRGAATSLEALLYDENARALIVSLDGGGGPRSTKPAYYDVELFCPVGHLVIPLLPRG